MPCVNHPEVQDGLNRCARCRQPFCGNCLVEIQGRSLCADCKTEQVQDLKSGVETAGAAPLQLAGIGSRFLALIIDGLIFIPLYFGGILFIFSFHPFPQDALQDQQKMQAFIESINIPLILFSLFASSLPFVYEGWMLMSRGQTLGKMALGIKVVRPDGGDLSTGQAWIRPAVRYGIGFIPIVACCVILANYIWALCTKERTCLHDLAAKTRVVKLP